MKKKKKMHTKIEPDSCVSLVREPPRAATSSLAAAHDRSTAAAADAVCYLERGASVEGKRRTRAGALP